MNLKTLKELIFVLLKNIAMNNFFNQIMNTKCFFNSNLVSSRHSTQPLSMTLLWIVGIQTNSRAELCLEGQHEALLTLRLNCRLQGKP